MRCVTPFIVVNGIPSNDAGIANQIGANALYLYEPKNTTLIAKDDYYTYDTYPPFNVKTIVPAELNPLCLTNMWGLFNHNCACK